MKIDTYEYLDDVFCVMSYSNYNNSYKLYFYRDDTRNAEMIISFYVVTGTDQISVLSTYHPRFPSWELYQEISVLIEMLKSDVIKQMCTKPSFKFMELFK